MIRTSIQNLSQLGAAGRTVIQSRDQLAAILRNRIGTDAALLLAVPTESGDGQIVWSDADHRVLKPVAYLPEAEQIELLRKFDDLRDRITALAERISGEGDAGRIAGLLLRLAVVTPAGFKALHAADGKPVLVNWGLAAEGQSVPQLEPPAERPSAPPLVAAMNDAVPASVGDATGAAQTANGSAHERLPKPAAGAIAWLLPLLLLAGLGYAIWLLTQPVPPVIVERELPAPEVADPVPAARDRLAELRAHLAEAESLRDGLSGQCSLPPPEPVVPAAEPQPRPPAATENLPERDAAIASPPQEAVPEPVPPRLVPRRESVQLPPEVPPASELPPRRAQLPAQAKPESTLCEPGWTPTQRPEVMVVIDGSGSMQESFPGATSRIAAAKDAVGQVVQKLHKDIKIGLVSFTDCNSTSTPRKYDYAERPDLLSQVRGVSPTRGTSLANSIRRAGNAAKSVGPSTVVVVSDGEDTCGGNPCGAARELKARKPLLTINVIDLSGGSSSVLQCVANATGGQVFTPRSAGQMADEMQEATGQPDASRCKP